jgi:urease accessory protein
MALAITRFAEAEVENYARSTAPFAFDAWRVVDKALRGGGAERCSSCNRSRSKGKQRAQPESEVMSGSEVEVQTVLEAILALDAQQEACLLSHVSRRSSKAQGVAMLTLYSRGLSRPEGFDLDSDLQNGDEGESLASFKREEMAKELVEGYKRWIRKGSAPGHLAVCWGVMTAALGLSIGEFIQLSPAFLGFPAEKMYADSPDRALHLHLFLHARSLLSSAVRLNLIGPYLSSQLLLFPFEGIIEKHLDDPGSTGVIQGCKCKEQVDEKADSADDFWSWAEEAENGPATTWPLGEVLMARHDLQHSRIFNS